MEILGYILFGFFISWASQKASESCEEKQDIRIEVTCEIGQSEPYDPKY